MKYHVMFYIRAVSYGGIGIVVAHEITHGFDSNGKNNPSTHPTTTKPTNPPTSLNLSGRLYDKSGDLFNWWTETSNDAFVRKSQCFVGQYSNISDYDMNVSEDYIEHCVKLLASGSETSAIV
jgi:predicted metalloendopeptidase